MMNILIIIIISHKFRTEQQKVTQEIELSWCSLHIFRQKKKKQKISKTSFSDENLHNTNIMKEYCTLS